jgi:YHS domain-containing protein
MQTLPQRSLFLLFFALSMLLGGNWTAASPLAQGETRPGLAQYNLQAGLALGGMDPVSYFAEFGGTPLAGNRQLAHNHRGVTYHFASEANRASFVAQPERFEPAYGGWCAFNMSKGKRVEPQASNYRFQDGRLLVFSKGGLLGSNPRSQWERANPRELLGKADLEWQKLSAEAPPVVAENDRDRPELGQMNLGADGLALEGFDPVSYFAEFGGRGLRGSPQQALRYRGVLYRFVSPENKAAFVANPQRFEPAYGGWCAYAMAAGDKVEINTSSFLVQDGRLLLFYDGLLGDTRKQWQAGDVATQATKADTSWAALLAKPR